MGSREHDVIVHPLPHWVDRTRLLGDAAWAWDADSRTASARLTTRDAADLAARLRRMGLDGEPIQVEARPRLPRTAVRAARTEDARRRRDTTPGFRKSNTRLDDEGRRSLTPEVLAVWMGRRAGEVRVLDAGCGAGGNAIGFARAGCQVLAVERDAHRLDTARHNARTYGVDRHIQFEHGDAAHAIRHARADLLFVDPPWGDWDKLSTCPTDLPLLELALTVGRERFARVWAKVPPSTDTRGIADCETLAVFGRAPGDRQRIKFLLLQLTGRSG
jgi:predicted RNA methylase